MSAQILAFPHCAATPRIAYLAKRVVSGVAAFNDRAGQVDDYLEDQECDKIADAYWTAWKKLAALPSRNSADIVEKLRAGEAICRGSDTEEFCELLWAECRRLTGETTDPMPDA